jgi:hypothetical protein
MSRNYSRKSDPVFSDLALIWDSANSDWRLSTLQDIANLFATDESVDATMKEPASQYAAPVASGSNVLVTDDNKDTHLILTPAATLAELTITLPSSGMARDKQRLLVNCTQQITSLTIATNGATAIYGVPSSLGADDFFTLKYDIVANSWYRIG